MDVFKEWLNKKDESKWIKRALTDPSYNSFRRNSVKKNDPRYDELNTPLPVNTELATYGDALIKLCYCDLFLDKCNMLSKEIEKYVTDEILVKAIAKKYVLLDHLDYDFKDDKIVRDYDYIKPSKTVGKNKKGSPHKYIATIVEAMIGAIYLTNHDLEEIKEILNCWKDIIDKKQL